MQRNKLLAGLLAGCFCLVAPAFAQDTTATAEREELESNYRRLSVKMEQLEEGMRAQQAKIAKLIEENRTLRLDLENLKARNENAATQEAINKLRDKIIEVDRARVSDGELVKKQFAALGREVSKTLTPKEPIPAPAPPKAEKTPPHDVDKPPPVQAAYTYKIKDGDTLNRIVTELRAQGYKVTMKQVMDANPTVNWSKLRIGQSVAIPPAQTAPPRPPGE